MKFSTFLTCLAVLAAGPAAAAEHVSVIGDSLTKEYQITFPGLPGLVEGIDSTNPGARNWSEFLHANRGDFYDLGQFKNVLFTQWTDMRLLGHEYNWAIPGATSRLLRNLLLDPDNTELGSDEDFNTLKIFAPDWKQTSARFAAQLSTTSYAAVIWCGGNDLRFGSSDPAASSSGTPVTYETIYEGDGTGAGNPALLTASIKANIQAIGQFIRTANPSLPIAVCAVPHVGCSPVIKASWPTDPVRTGRITTALDALNADLKTWTETTLGGVWVDTYTITKILTGSSDLAMGGISFANASDPKTAADPTPVHNRWIFAHDGFHPTSAVQAVIAQMVHDALRAKFPAKFGTSPAITTREIIGEFLDIPLQTGYDEFMAAAGITGPQSAPGEDSDGDGLANVLEFILAGNGPGSAVPVPPVAGSAGGALTLTWTPRYADNVFAALTAEQSSSLTDWTAVPAGQIAMNADGSLTARAAGTGPLFLRLRAETAPNAP